MSEELTESTPLPRWPKYLRVKQDLTKRLEDGQFDPDLPIPSEKSLAESIGVSIGTIRQALAEMANEGLIRREQGRGTFVNVRVHAGESQAMEAFAIVLPEIDRGSYPSMVRGFDAAGNELHHPTVICNTQNDVAQQANYFMRLIDRRVSGIAVVTPTRGTTPAYQIRQVQQAGIPVVFLRRDVDGISAPLIKPDPERVGRIAGREIGKRGHTRVAFTANLRYSVSESYERGMRAGLAEFGVELTDELVDYGAFEYTTDKGWSEYSEYLEQTVLRMLERADRPTAIFTGFDSYAEVIYVAASKLRMTVPDDLFVVSFGDVRRHGAVMQQVAAVTEDSTGMGRRAALMLDEMRRGRRSIDDSSTFEVDLSFYPGCTRS